MKFNLALIALVHAGDDTRDDDQWYGPASNGTLARSGGRNLSDNGERRYDDLEAIANKYWRKQGLTGKDKFDERKYWAYGCNCLILGDRPMSDPGMGKPVDELDVVCKAYKDCVKCVQMEYGETCIGEFKRYRYGMNTRTNQVTCKDAPGTCERALCECDNQFGQQVSHRI